MNPVDAVQAVAFACHQALEFPQEDMARAMLLEAVASFKATQLADFPASVLELVKLSHDRADALSDRVLASDDLADPWIHHDTQSLCLLIGALAEAMRPSSAVNAGEGEE
ncbi:hypothetical protein [Reyranella soli]|nr:hypothetical protein [Reyranella soli]